MLRRTAVGALSAGVVVVGAVPAAANPWHGQGNGYGNGSGNGNGNGAQVAAAQYTGNWTAQNPQPAPSVHSYANGHGNGNSNGRGNGRGSYQPTAAAATPSAQAQAVTQTVATGPASANGHGNGNGNGNGRSRNSGSSNGSTQAKPQAQPAAPAPTAAPAAATPALAPAAPPAASNAPAVAPSAPADTISATPAAQAAGIHRSQPKAKKAKASAGKAQAPSAPASTPAAHSTLAAAGSASALTAATAPASPGTGTTQPQARSRGNSDTKKDSGLLASAETAIPQTIEHLVKVIPGWVWLALIASGCLAAVAALAAILAGRRARRQMRAVAAAEQAAATDPLTGAMNRRGFGDAVERELARASRHNRPLALAYLDVRGLKAVNDGDGHLAGDALIQRVAGLLSESARAGDVVARLGGDEFALLLPEQSAKEAAIVRDRLLAQVPDCRAAIGTEYPWNLTVGIAAYPEDGESFETLLAAADRRLYAQRGTCLRAGNEHHAGTAVPAPALATS
jgi:diguanylate cyclase (GGDEF)-like protein